MRLQSRFKSVQSGGGSHSNWKLFDFNVCIPRIRRPFGCINSLKAEHLFINACNSKVVIPERFGIKVGLFLKKTRSRLLLK